MKSAHARHAAMLSATHAAVPCISWPLPMRTAKPEAQSNLHPLH
jgi:hypothetical protein